MIATCKSLAAVGKAIALGCTVVSTVKPVVRKLRCAVYTRKSSEEGLEQEFNSLDAQREACEAYIASQKADRRRLRRSVARISFTVSRSNNPGVSR